MRAWLPHRPQRGAAAAVAGWHDDDMHDRHATRMTRAEAIAAVRASVAHGSSTATLGTGDHAAYVRNAAEDLDATMVDPVPATVCGEAHGHGLQALLETAPALVIAHRDANWRGFVPATGILFLAHGASPDALDALGFHSDDALAEWLG